MDKEQLREKFDEILSKLRILCDNEKSENFVAISIYLHSIGAKGRICFGFRKIFSHNRLSPRQNIKPLLNTRPPLRSLKLRPKCKARGIFISFEGTAMVCPFCLLNVSPPPITQTPPIPPWGRSRSRRSGWRNSSAWIAPPLWRPRTPEP